MEGLIMNKLTKSVLAGLVMCISTASFAEDKAEKAFTDEVIQCAAYYQISSEAIKAMNAPQMKDVSERLVASADLTAKLATKYRDEAQVTLDVAAEKDRQVASLAEASNLGALMEKYKDSCKNVVMDPQKRLDYWIMATM